MPTATGITKSRNLERFGKSTIAGRCARDTLPWPDSECAVVRGLEDHAVALHIFRRKPQAIAQVFHTEARSVAIVLDGIVHGTDAPGATRPACRKDIAVGARVR